MPPSTGSCRLVAFGSCGHVEQQLHAGRCLRQVTRENEDQSGSRVDRQGGRHTEGPQAGDHRSRGPPEDWFFPGQQHAVGHRSVSDDDHPLGIPSRIEHAIQQRPTTHRQGALVDAPQPGTPAAGEDDRVEADHPTRSQPRCGARVPMTRTARGSRDR
jgi:hypothetical protein